MPGRDDMKPPYTPTHHIFYAVPAIYDITIVSRGEVPSLLDVINAKPSAADVLIRSAQPHSATQTPPLKAHLHDTPNPVRIRISLIRVAHKD